MNCICNSTSEVGVQSPELSFVGRAKVDFHRSLRWNCVDTFTALDTSDVKGGAGFFRRWIINESSDGATKCMDRVRRSKVSPRVSAWAFQMDAITTRAQRLVCYPINSWPINADKEIDAIGPHALG